MLIIAILVICLVVTAAEIQTKFIQRLIDNLLYDNRNHYLSCEQLPDMSKVMQVVEVHQNLIQEIEQIKPGLVGVDIDTFTCPGKADLIFWYGSHANRLTIEGIIDNETFFGVPYRLHNR